MGDHTQLKAMLVLEEGALGHMYLDTVGLVTVGVGHMTPNAEAAQKLSFIVRSNGSAATSDQIAADYASVSRQQKGMLAPHYQPFTSLDMAEDAIQDLLSADVAEVEAGVRARFAGYDEYPEPAQDALLDMAFNLGVAGLAGKYPHLTGCGKSRSRRLALQNKRF